MIDRHSDILLNLASSAAAAIGAVAGQWRRAGPLFHWYKINFSASGFLLICVVTRHMKAARSSQSNLTDMNDAPAWR
ncbi:hypothetical protein [Paracoccus sp. Ld10]|uniref:hypothetical protein n=1 Tax=Paracoccus sp. Ld10 TaxID=649158 RepID=UPI0038636A19